MTSGPFSDVRKEKKLFGAVAVLTVIVMCTIACIPAISDESDAAIPSNSQQIPLRSLDSNAYECYQAGTIHVAVGSAVNVISDGGLKVTDVTTGYGLSVSNNTLTGIITKAGTIYVKIFLNPQMQPTFTIKAVDAGEIPDEGTYGSSSNPLSSLNVSADSVFGHRYYVQKGASVHVSSVSFITVDSVSSGFGLSASGGSLSGTLSKSSGEATVGCILNKQQYFEFYIVACPGASTPVTNISISGPSEVEEGSSITLKATTSPGSADNRHVSWSISSGSANGSISSQSDSSTGGSCVLRGSSAGTITVRATADDGSGTYATKTITVKSPAKTYYLRYDANGGYGAPAQQSADSSDGQYSFRVSSQQPSRSGYTFLGWSASSTASSPTYTSGDRVISYGTKILYAVWQQDLHEYSAKLYFDANGGYGAPSTMSHSKMMTSASGSHTFSVPNDTPSRDGYRFLGWSTNSGASYASYAGGNSISVSYDSSVTLYAVWEQLVISVSGSPESHAIVGSSWSYTPTINYGGCTVSVSGASWIHVSGNQLVGTPTEPGTYNITVNVTKNGYVSGSQSFSVTVLSALSFQSSPTGGAIIYAV